MSNPFNQALDEGFTREQIFDFMEKSPKFSPKLSQARNEGISDDDIERFFVGEQVTPRGAEVEEGVVEQTPVQQEKQQPNIVQRGIDKASRLGSQLGLGAIQTVTFPFDIGATLTKTLAEKGTPQLFRESLLEDATELIEKKTTGDFSEEDQTRLDRLTDLIKNPDKTKEFTKGKIPAFDVGSLIEKGAEQFGVDLSPQGVDEMAARWIGFIKNPAKARELMQNPFDLKNLKEVGKALLPTPKEAARGVGAASALQFAAEAELGPVGTLIAAVMGDVAAGLIGKGVKGFKTLTRIPKTDLLKTGKKGLTRTVAKFTSESKKEIQKNLVDEFREAGIQADFGTITGNNLIKWVQSTLSQSGLTRTPLENLRKSITQNIVSEYGKIASELGELTHSSRFEAGQSLQQGVKVARDLDLSKSREIFSRAKESGGDTQIFTGNTGETIKEILGELEPGRFKSSEQQTVLKILNEIKQDVLTEAGDIRSAGVDELINNKIALGDSINYEVQGGSKQLLKKVTKAIDRDLEVYGKENPQFGKDWKAANKNFSEHAKLFRGKEISEVLRGQDPSKIFARMNTPNGIRTIKKALNNTPEGRKLFSELSRFKLEEMIGDNLVNSTTGQANFGSFSKLLQKQQNRDVARALLGDQGLKQLERLQKASGRLAETAEKFFNASQSGRVVGDMAFIAKVVGDFANVFAGNPWPIVRSGGILLGTRQVAKLMADPEFLKLMEEAMIESKSGSQESLIQIGQRLAARAKQVDKSIKPAVRTTLDEENR